MNELVRTGQVSHRDILRSYRLCHRYGLTSIWHGSAYMRDIFRHRRYRLLAETAACCADDIPAGDLDAWRPLRTFSLWNALTWDGDMPSLNGAVLSPFEYDLILLCAGKLPLHRLIDTLYARSRAGFRTKREFATFVRTCLRHFEQRNLVVFTPD
jgi:anaerobic magnesium-protoporphyrin IX monomethyl ester cyclase